MTTYESSHSDHRRSGNTPSDLTAVSECFTQRALGTCNFPLVSLSAMSTPTRLTMKQAAAAQRSFSLRLYRALLRSHRAVLPSVMRDLGDAYVREEFKRHKTATPQHLNAFFREWLSCRTQQHPPSLSSLSA